MEKIMEKSWKNLDFHPAVAPANGHCCACGLPWQWRERSERLGRAGRDGSFMLFLWWCAHRIIPGLVLVDETWGLKCNSSYQNLSNLQLSADPASVGWDMGLDADSGCRSLRFAVWCGSFLDCGRCESKDCGVYCNPSTAATLSFAGGMLAEQLLGNSIK